MATAPRPTTVPVVRRRAEVRGIVQGVGFRPYVHGLATELGLAGFVGNDAHGAFVEVEGSADRVARFLERLRTGAPPLAVVDEIVVCAVPERGDDRFVIAPSDDDRRHTALVPPDVGPCDACLGEVADPADRRYRYPFANCTGCGPRFTITRAVPYDRPNTTMAGFARCEHCRAEYDDPSDRRFHAQPVCCPACGPRLELVDARGAPIGHDPIGGTVALLQAGRIVAVKGVGGFHLAVDASDDAAVARLRRRKHREDKPFALLALDLAAARRIALVDDDEAALLRSPARPIVLLRRRGGAEAAVAPSVAPGIRSLGIMLPPSPLHHLLAEAFGRPLVLTSGNRSQEPIAFRDAEAGEQLAGIADATCTHDRPIHVRVDDSVVRVVAGRTVPVRRARGYAPAPIHLPVSLPRHVLGVGAQLKSTICVGRDHLAFVSQHLGDLDDAESFRSFVEAVDHHERLFDVRPEVVAHDLHPDFHSTGFARELDGVDTVAVQHHHAHIASCLVDNAAGGPVIGVAFDGFGLGDDGSSWGGEFLVADLATYERVGHLRPVAQPGGDRATREPWRMAASHLDSAGSPEPPIEALDVARRNRERWGAVVSLAGSGLSPRTSSVGRLFDAVASLLGVRDTITYEGQAAIELEQLADPDEAGALAVRTADGAPFVVEASDLVVAAADELDRGVAVATIAARFHNAVAAIVVEGCERVRTSHGLSSVALSGGVFQNAVLVERAVTALEERGFEVLTHRKVPPNDGGISLGQVAVAGALDRAG